MGKKNLEQLFKESFQDFQEVPDQKVWASIKASLDSKKQKKRMVPIWWGLGGIAATLAILLLTTNPFAEEPKEEQIISDRENISLPKSSENNNKGAIDSNSASQVANEGNPISNKAVEEKENRILEDNLDVASKTAVATKRPSNSKRIGVAVVNQAEKSNFTKPEAPLSKKDDTINNNQVAGARDKKNESLNDQVLFDKQEAIAQNKKKEEDKKQSIYDAIQEQETVEELAAENKTGKWSVGPSLAPVYFDATGDGSPVGPDFSSNSKSGNLNLSYGLTVAYEVTKKIKIRSGIHRVDYGYSTNDVVFSSTLQAVSTNKIANIDYTPNSETIIVQSKDNAKSSPTLTSKEIALNETPSLEGEMLQQLGYIEVPLEINYAVLDKKFGIDLIGGVSSLFLVDNSVLLESDDLVTEVGKANNINSLNFSANVGMGLNYQFSPKIKINVEPVFKYQLNTFSNVSGTFQPYTIGVYSGFSFRF